MSGLELEVSGGDRFLLLRNDTGKQVIVKGYEDEPYLRFLPNKVVEENTRSPSKYANEDRYALTPLPPQANSEAPPKWQRGLRRTARTGGSTTASTRWRRARRRR